MAAPKRRRYSETASHPGGSTLTFTARLPAQADFKKVLLERYQEAIARSRKIGHRVSFRVEVDPAAGAQTITPVEERPIASHDAFPVEDTGRPDAELEAALAEARERGRKRVAETAWHVEGHGQCQAAERAGAGDRWRQARLSISRLATRQGRPSVRGIAGAPCDVGQ
jgi:hypothetical protein